MTKAERNKALADGKIIIRAQLTRWGWRVMRITDKGGWTQLIGVVFTDRSFALNACTDLIDEHPELYRDDNN